VSPAAPGRVQPNISRQNTDSPVRGNESRVSPSDDRGGSPAQSRSSDSRGSGGGRR
jgi:hypothetical protein